MKKNILLVLIGLIAGTTLTATAAYVYTARDIGYSPSDENWNVTNAGDALSSLKNDLNQISTDVNNYKSEIIEALNNNGSELTNSSSMDEIVTSINNSNNGLPKFQWKYNASNNHTFDSDIDAVGATYLVFTGDKNDVITYNFSQNESDANKFNYSFSYGGGTTGSASVNSINLIGINSAGLQRHEVTVTSTSGTIDATDPVVAYFKSIRFNQKDISTNISSTATLNISGNTISYSINNVVSGLNMTIVYYTR